MTAIPRLPVKSNGPAFKPGLQRLRNLNARDAVAQGLLLEQFGADHFFAFTPVLTDTEGASIIPDDSDGFVCKRPKHHRIRATEACLDATALTGAQKEFFGDGVGIAVKTGNVTLRRALDYALARLARRGMYGELYLKYFPIGPF